MTSFFASFSNLDLLSVGVAVAGIGILGFAIYFSNRRSITNKALLFFSLVTVVWGISNYFNYQFQRADLIIWALRSHFTISVTHAFSFFLLAYVFPKEKTQFSKYVIRFVI